MTDITTTAPIRFPAVRTMRPRVRFLAIGRSLGAVLQTYCRSIELAYVAPWAGHAKQKGPAPDADPLGRDPNW